MPSRRMIHPDFWRSESMARLTERQRLLFIGLISNADDQGRIRAHPALIRSDVYPFDDKPLDDIEADLNQIADVGSIQLYDVDGKRYCQILGWWVYQKPKWAWPSDIPAPDGWTDRLRYRVGNKPVKENWEGDEGDDDADTERDGDEAEPFPSETTVEPPRSHSETTPESAPRSRSRSRSSESTPTGAQAPAPKRKRTAKTLTPSQQMFKALAEICAIDLRTLTEGQRGQLNQSEKILRDAGATPEQMPGFRKWWDREDWRGKRGEVPEPHQVRAEWGRYMESLKASTRSPASVAVRTYT